MPDTPISGLPDASALTGAELFALTQGGVSKKVSGSVLATLMSAAAPTQNWAVPFRGALAKRTSDLTGIVWAVMIPWQDTYYDTDGFWSVGNPSRLTIPAGVTKVRLIGSSALELSGAAGSVYCNIYKNGAAAVCGVSSPRNYTDGYSNNDVFTISPVVDVVEGDYFELRVNCTISGVDQIAVDEQTFFGIEVVEVSDAEARPYDLPAFIVGTPAASSIAHQTVLNRVARILPNGGESQYYAATAPTADTVFDVQKNGVSIGSLTFLNGANTGTYSGAQTDFAIGDRFALVAPAALNGIADISVNHKMVLV